MMTDKKSLYDKSQYLNVVISQKKSALSAFWLRNLKMN